MGLYNWRNKLAVDLPMRMAQHDPVNAQTLDVGRQGLDFDFGAGALEPTKLGYRRGYHFDGDRMISEATIQSSVVAISVFMMFKIDDWSITSYLADHRVDGGNINWLILHTANAIRFYSGGAAAANGASYLWDQTGTIITIVGVYDGTNTILYEGGVQRAVAATPLAPAGEDEDIHLGENSSSAQRFTGDIYHFGFWNGVAASPTQVSQYDREMMKRFHQI